MSNGTDLSTRRETPVVDFTSADFESIKQDLITFLQARYSDRFTDFNDDQLGVVMLDVAAYLGDLLGYSLNASVRELFAASAVRRQNLANICKPFGVFVGGAQAAKAIVRFTLDPAATYPQTLTPSARVSNGSTADEVFFQPVADTIIDSYPTDGYVDVECAEGERFDDALIGISTGAPNQRWQIPSLNVIDDSIEITVGAATWTRTENFAQADRSAQAYKVVLNDDGNSFVFFGDGTFGAVPPTKAQIRATFRVGGGRRGNLGRNTIETLVSVDSFVLSATNPERSSGGEDAQSMKAARAALPASLVPMDRAVSVPDYAPLALQVPGVARARASGSNLGGRAVTLTVAPNGGGEVTPSLLTSVSAFFRNRRMVNTRIGVRGAIYPQVRLAALLHISTGWRATEVEQAFRQMITTAEGAGLLDFAQLDFAGTTMQENTTTLLLAQTRLQAYFAALRDSGLQRVEIQQLDVVPQARPRDSGNVGDGEIADGSILLNSRQRRRRYFVELTSATTYRVTEKIVGWITSMTDVSITDGEKQFETEGVPGFAGYVLTFPESGTSAAVLGAEGQVIRTSPAQSLFAVTEVGAPYEMQSAASAAVAVGSAYTSTDGSVQFVVSAGSVPFMAGDSFTIDVYPKVSDLRLAENEYPELLAANFTTRTAGGVRT